MSQQLKRNVYVLSIYSFLRGVGNSIFMTLFPLYLLVLGYSMSDIGAIATISYLISGLVVPFLGLLVDYYGRKPFVILTGLTTVVSLIILGYSTSYILLVTSYALMNFSFLAGQPARGAMLAESVSRERMGEAFGFVTTAFFISRVFMPSIAGFMADTIGYKITFVIGGIIVLLGVLFFWAVSIETIGGGRRPSFKDVIKALKPSRNLGWLYIGVIIDRFSWALWMPLLNAYIEDVYGLGATEIGFLNSIMSFSSLVTQYLSGKWVDKIGYLMGLALSELSGLVAVVLIGFSNSIESLVLGLISIGLSISLWIPSYNNAIALNTEKEERAVEYSKANSY
ncbi:hypothetical protein DRN84_03030, partial [Candidatus Geothermarchaeota archaeon]